MTQAAAKALAVSQALVTVMRQDKGRLVAALIAQFRDYQLAEDALQDAASSALVHWSRTGLPSSPLGWLLKVARNKAIDRLRQRSRDTAYAVETAALDLSEMAPDTPEIPDDRLRLIFTCCHPALDPKSRIALTLRTLGGLTTSQIAAAFLDQDTTMGQRLSRAKAKIAAAKIPFAIPDPEDWPVRMSSVLSVIYLIFNQGYTVGPLAEVDLCDEAIFLARILDHLRPDDPEIKGCLALQLIIHARRHARCDPQGVTLTFADQDRRLWDQPQINEGVHLIQIAMQQRRPGPYQIKAAIAACQVQGDAPDWPQIAALYDALLRHEPSPVIQLNRAVAVAESGGLQDALNQIAQLASGLNDYQPYHAAAAALYARAGQVAESDAAYQRAIAMAPSAADAAFLRKGHAALRHK